MEPFLYYLLRASIVTALFYGFYKLLFGKNTFYNANRFLLLSVLIISVILPIFHFNLLPEVKDPLSQIALTNSANITYNQITGTRQNFIISRVQILIVVFVTGLLFFFIRYIIGLYQIKRIINCSEKRSVSGNITLCITNKSVSPFSWLNYIVLSQKDYLTETKDGAILQHERAHIQMNHSLDMILSDLFTCLFWFNPFSWLLRREIQSVHEYQADEQVLNHGIDAKQYQLLIIRKSVGEHKFALANNFRQRYLHKRITMMIKTKSNNRTKWGYAAALPVFFLAMIALSVPKLKAQEVKTDPPEKTVFEIGTNENYRLRIDGNNSPIFVLDGIKIDFEEVKMINPDDIESISVLKDKSATEFYGQEGKNGVVIITSKRNSPELKPLIILNGKKMPENYNLNSIDAADIYSIDVLKNESAIEKYGNEGKNGVVEIITINKE